MKKRIQYEPCMYCSNRIEVTYEIPDDYPEYIAYFSRDHGLYCCKKCMENLEQSLKPAREFLKELRINKNSKE